MELKGVLENLKKSIDKFLEIIARKEEEEWKVDLKISRLEDIVSGKNKDFWLIKERFKGLKSWLRIEGKGLNSQSIKRKQIQRMIQCLERMKVYGEMIKEEERLYPEGDKILWQANSFIRENLRRQGLEYTPLGILDFVQLDESLLRLKEEIRTLDKWGTDLKSGYQKTLTYQLDLLDYFYKPKDHLLTILDYQLKNLEARSSKEDELFTASLIYYLKQNRYKMEPYLERFRKILKQKRVATG